MIFRGTRRKSGGMSCPPRHSGLTSPPAPGWSRPAGHRRETRHLDILLLLILLVVSALFSGSETAFFSLGAAEVARLEQTAAAPAGGWGAAAPGERPAVGPADRQPAGQHRRQRGRHQPLPALVRAAGRGGGGAGGDPRAAAGGRDHAQDAGPALPGTDRPLHAGPADPVDADQPAGAAADPPGGRRPAGAAAVRTHRHPPHDHRGTADRLRPGGGGRHPDRDRGALPGPAAAAGRPGGAADHDAAHRGGDHAPGHVPAPGAGHGAAGRLQPLPGAAGGGRAARGTVPPEGPAGAGPGLEHPLDGPLRRCCSCPRARTWPPC